MNVFPLPVCPYLFSIKSSLSSIFEEYRKMRRIRKNTCVVAIKHTLHELRNLLEDEGLGGSGLEDFIKVEVHLLVRSCLSCHTCSLQYSINNTKGDAGGGE